MQQFKITTIEENQNIMTYLRKLLPVPSIGFLKKMTRKKIIKLNNQKIKGEEILKSNDVITLYFSEEMFDSFSRMKLDFEASLNNELIGEPSGHPYHHNLDVIKEDDHILIVNKPIGLPLRSKHERHTLTDDIEYYLSSETKDILGYKPGIVNYLDKNTSGIILAGKDIKSSQSLNYAITHDQIETQYRTIVQGIIIEEIILLENEDDIQSESSIIGKIKPINASGSYSEVNIIISKGLNLNIRAVMAEHGYPIVGDKKYGDSNINQVFKKKYRLKYQLLHAASITFYDIPEPLKYMANHTLYVDPPAIYKSIYRELFR